MNNEVETTGVHTASPELILSLLRKQVELYTRLEIQAGKQRALIADEDTGPLLALLADRQKLSADLLRVGQCLTPVRAQWSAVRARFTAGQRAEADGLLARTAACLQRVIQRDEEDARVLAARKASVSQSLYATQASGQALSAYRAAAEPAGRLNHLNEA